MVRRHHIPLIAVALCGLLASSLGALAQGAPDDQPPLGVTNTPPPPPPGAPPTPPPGAPKNFFDRWTPEQRQKMQDWMTQKMGTNLSPDAWKQLTPEQREALREKMKEFKNEWKEMEGGLSKKDGAPKGDRRPIPLWDERFPKMIEIAAAPEEKVQTLATQIAASRNESPEKQQEIVAHIMEFRKHLRDEALQAAKNMNVRLTPDKEGDFIRTFWTKRMEIEKSLHQEVEPRRKQMLEQAREELSKQFGGTPPPAVGDKPPKPSNPLPPPNP